VYISFFVAVKWCSVLLKLFRVQLQLQLHERC